jgi:hypothetical protein
LRKNDVEARHDKIWEGDDDLFEVTNLKIEERGTTSSR